MCFLSVTLTVLSVTNGAFTVNPKDPETPWNAATIPAVPGDTPVATPVADTLAIPGASVTQVTRLVSTCVDLSEKVPIAVNCSFDPARTLGLAGLTVIDCKAAAPTVSTVEPVIPFRTALIVELP